MSKSAFGCPQQGAFLLILSRKTYHLKKTMRFRMHVFGKKGFWPHDDWFWNGVQATWEGGSFSKSCGNWIHGNEWSTC